MDEEGDSAAVFSLVLRAPSEWVNWTRRSRELVGIQYAEDELLVEFSLERSLPMLNARGVV